MANEYTRRWFTAFMDTVPPEWTGNEVAGVAERLPLPDFGRVLDACCGPGRHAAALATLGYTVTGIDRDAEVLDQARQAAPGARFLELDQRDLDRLRPERPFDAAVVLWQSFGYFDPATNDRVLANVARLLRPGGRLLLDLFHPGWFVAHAGRTTTTRSPDVAAITNTLHGDRLTSTIDYTDGTGEAMDFELFTPEALVARAAPHGFRLREACCWWDASRPPDPTEQRYQVVLECVRPRT